MMLAVLFFGELISVQKQVRCNYLFSSAGRIVELVILFDGGCW